MFKTMLLAMLAAGSVPAPAIATTTAQDRLPDVAVSYGDLNLATDAGIVALDRRIAMAAQAACNDASGLRDIARLREIRQCWADKRRIAMPFRDAALARARAGDARVAAR